MGLTLPRPSLEGAPITWPHVVQIFSCPEALGLKPGEQTAGWSVASPCALLEEIRDECSPHPGSSWSGPRDSKGSGQGNDCGPEALGLLPWGLDGVRVYRSGWTLRKL